MMTDRDHSSLSRRGVIGGFAVVGTAAAVAVIENNGAVVSNATRRLASAALGVPAPQGPLASGEIEAWQAAIGADFGTAGTTLRLAGVRPLASRGVRPRGLRRSAFVAVFELPLMSRLPGGLIYTLTNPVHGPLDLFMVEGTGRFANRLYAVLN